MNNYDENIYKNYWKQNKLKHIDIHIYLNMYFSQVFINKQ